VPDLEAEGILDYDNDVLNLYTISIHEFGFSVKCFSDPQSILDYVKSYPAEIGLLMIKYKMKHMIGCHLANEVNSINTEIKMAFVTG
jgi:FixJ family two-component response regulator